MTYTVTSYDNHDCSVDSSHDSLYYIYIQPTVVDT